MYVVGASGQAREFADQIPGVAAFAVDDDYLSATKTDLPVISLGELAAKDAPAILVGVGAPGLRRDFAQRLPHTSTSPVAVHDTAYVSRDAKLGDGTVVAPQAAISTGAKLGRHVQVNLGATISHDTVLGDFCTVAPGANVAGGVTLGDGVFVGVGAVIMNGIKLASGCVVGAGAVVIESVSEPNSVLVGNPARVLRQDKDWMHEI